MSDNIKKIETEAEKLLAETQQFMLYYKDNIEMLQQQQESLTKLDKLLNDKINEITSAGRSPGTATILGTYLENLINLKSLQQQCNQQQINIKKLVFEYTLKTRPKEQGNDDLGDAIKTLRKLVKEVGVSNKKQNVATNDYDDGELDAIIDANLDDI